MTVTLRRWTRSQPVALDQAVGETATILGDDAIVLATGVSGTRFAVLRDESLAPTLGADVYSVRVFSPRAELRWLRHQGESGARAVLLSIDDDVTAPQAAGWSLNAVDAFELLELRYLLWGERIRDAESAPTGWTALSEARVGTIYVPGVLSDDRAQLVAYEVHAGPDENGNVIVTDELLSHVEAGNRGPLLEGLTTT